MQYPKLELHISLVERLIANSRSRFSNKKKQKIYDNMLYLFDKIRHSDYKQFSSQQLDFAKTALDIVFYSVEFLNYRNESEIPKRLIFCLNKLIDDWIPGGTDEYFIVISYNNTPNDFSVRAADQAQLKGIKTLLKFLFEVDYSQSLIQITKPRFFANDYLSCVPLYHELGHFVEKNYQIVTALSREPDFEQIKITKEHFLNFLRTFLPLNILAEVPSHRWMKLKQLRQRLTQATPKEWKL